VQHIALGATALHTDAKAFSTRYPRGRSRRHRPPASRR
jgi:hypothetical protein